jgi:hypothetical protein
LLQTVYYSSYVTAFNFTGQQAVTKAAFTYKSTQYLQAFFFTQCSNELFFIIRLVSPVACSNRYIFYPIK